MASDSSITQQDRSLSAGMIPRLGWFPIALGAAAIVAGLGRRNKGTMTLALTTFAGVTAVGAVRDGQLDRRRAMTAQDDGARGEPEVERAITIGRAADMLRQCWLAPNTVPRIMAGFATVSPSGDGRERWRIEGPFGHVFEWESEAVDGGQGEAIVWRSLSGASIPNEGSVRFHPAPADRGTVATLRLRFDPPGGALGDAAVRHFGTTPLNLAVDGVLRRFKSLVLKQARSPLPTVSRRPARHPLRRLILRALYWNGVNDLRVGTVKDPEIVNPRDAILQRAACRPPAARTCTSSTATSRP